MPVDPGDPSRLRRVARGWREGIHSQHVLGEPAAGLSEDRARTSDPNWPWTDLHVAELSLFAMRLVDRTLGEVNFSTEGC